MTRKQNVRVITDVIQQYTSQATKSPTEQGRAFWNAKVEALEWAVKLLKEEEND